MISSNIGEVLSILFTTLFGLPEGLSSIQLLWINFVTDGLPAMALSFNKPDQDALGKKPRKKDEKLLDKWMIIRYLIVGFYVGAATCLGSLIVRKYANYYLSYDQINLESICSTMSLTVLVLIEMWNSLNALSENQSLIKVGLFSNMWLWGAISISISTHLSILYIKPFARIFGTSPLNLKQWLLTLALSLPVVLIEEILKLFSRN
jgi:Ca2+ transporting ATPase